MILSIVSICLSAFTAIVVTVMPVIQTSIKGRNNRKMEKFKFIQQEQRTAYYEVLDKYVEYTSKLNDETSKALRLALYKASLFAKDVREQQRYKTLEKMLTNSKEFDGQRFAWALNDNIDQMRVYLNEKI